jgi:aminoglycoside phosphotransferase (APT) family kinase protein
MGHATEAATGPPSDKEAQGRALHDRILRYARGPLVGRLGEAELPTALEPATGGARSVVYFVDFPSGRRVVLRAVPRWLRAARLAYNFRSMKALGLPVPALLHAGLSPLTRLRWGFHPIVEEFVAGQDVPALGYEEGAVRAVALALARLHAVERRRWGWPGLSRFGSYRAYYLARLARRVRDLDDALAERRGEALGAWLRDQAPRAPLDPPFALTHSRVNPGNIVVTPDGEAVVLDLIECRYGAWGPDLVSALRRLCGGLCERQASLLDEYFGHLPSGRREAFERSRPLFEAAYDLAEAAVNARWVARAAAAGRAAEWQGQALAESVARLAAATGIELTLAER